MEARQRTVGHLQQLYTVVVGVALTLAITKLLDERAEQPFWFGRRQSPLTGQEES